MENLNYYLYLHVFLFDSTKRRNILQNGCYATFLLRRYMDKKAVVTNPTAFI